MFGQLWVVDEPEPVDGFVVDPEPVDGFDVAAGEGDAAELAARAGPASARAAPAPAPITGRAARSQSFLLSRIGVTSFSSWTHRVEEAVLSIMERIHENGLGNGCEIGVSAPGGRVDPNQGRGTGEAWARQASL
jgi:hypothetical protein